MTLIYIYIIFLAFDFCRFCVVIRCFHPTQQRPMTSDFEGFSIPDFIHYIYFPILMLEKEPVFHFLIFSAKQGHYCYHFNNVFGMTLIEWRHITDQSKKALTFEDLNMCICIHLVCYFYKLKDTTNILLHLEYLFDRQYKTDLRLVLVILWYRMKP